MREKTEKILNTRFHSSSGNYTNVGDIQMILLEACRDFKDPTDTDKIYSCNKTLNNLTSDMKLNVKKMLDSNDSLAVKL